VLKKIQNKKELENIIRYLYQKGGYIKINKTFKIFTYK